MGLSRGWGDLYGAFTVGQYLDITGLADGRYRVRVTADGDSADGSDRFLDPAPRRSAEGHTDVVGLIGDPRAKV